MTSPAKEVSDPGDSALKNYEDKAPNDCNTDIQPPPADPNIISQVETNPINREPGTSTTQEDIFPQEAENIELEVDTIKKDIEKGDIKGEESLLIQIPIPRKWIFLMSGLERITSMSIPLVKIDKSNTLADRSRFYSGNVDIKASDFRHSGMNYKIPLQLSISWRIPFINNYEIRRMILHLLCGRHFSQATGRPNTLWVKQKYLAFLPRRNVLIHSERAIIFGRPLRVYYYRPLIERMTSGKFYKSMDTKWKDGFHVFVRPVFYVPQTQIQNTFNRKAFEDHLRSYHNMRVVTISTNNGWKYLCPICRSSFNNFVEFRQHSCNFPGN
ncbi:CPX chromosomal region candidate gene 1 protein [Nycticebus coucang]|uniref:CPX chromosomal region candidate gene 1 protein n=1 Tax=Nycticebus coucang TaxID=9470 RepID=UPI00234C5329|nr:CPX chromosomal region candidate gene 1 protein [Nycticebus coucang]